MIVSLLTEIRSILAAAKTVDGARFTDFVGHVSVATANFETNEKVSLVINGFAPDPDDEEEVEPVRLYRYSFGWVLKLDNGDEYLIA